MQSVAGNTSDEAAGASPLGRSPTTPRHPSTGGRSVTDASRSSEASSHDGDSSGSSATSFSSSAAERKSYEESPNGNGHDVVVAEATPTVTPTPVKQLSILGVVLLSEAMSASSLFPYVGLYTGHLMDLDVNSVGLYSGLVVAIFTFGQLTSASLWGFLSDSYGRKVPMTIGLAAGTVACLLFGLAPNFLFCCVFRLIHGFFNGNVMIAKTIIADITDATNEAKGFSVMSFAWALGCLVGPTCGGVLYDPRTQTWLQWLHVEDGDFLARHPAFLPSLFLALYSCVATFTCVFWLEESNKKARSLFTVLPAAVQQRLSRWCSCLAPLMDKSLRNATELVVVSIDAEREAKKGKGEREGASECGGDGQGKCSDAGGEEDVQEEVVVTFRQALRSPLIRGVVTLVVAIGASDTAFEETLPLWCIATVSVGGLFLSSSQVAIIIATYCIPTLIANLVFSAVCDFFGDQLLLFRFCAYGLTILTVLIPIGSIIGGVWGYWYVLLVGIARQAVLSWAYGLLSMFTARCAPPGGVGQLFGLTQTASCAARCIVPMTVTAIFAWSISEKRSWRPFPFNYFFVFVLCSVLTVAAAATSYFISFKKKRAEAPASPTEREEGGPDRLNSDGAGCDSPHHRRQHQHHRYVQRRSRRGSLHSSSGGDQHHHDDGNDCEDSDVDSVASSRSVLRDMMASSYASAVASLNASFAHGAAMAVVQLHDEDAQERERGTKRRHHRQRQRDRRRRRHRAHPTSEDTALGHEDDTRGRRAEAEGEDLSLD